MSRAIPFAQPNVVPLSGFGARNFSTRPAPGTTTTYAKKGGFIKGEKHDDEAQDKKLIKKMIGKKASGGGVGPGLVGYKYRTNGPTGGKGKGLSPYSDAKVYRNQGKGFADGGNVHGAGSALGRMARNAKVPAKTSCNEHAAKPQAWSRCQQLGSARTEIRPACLSASTWNSRRSWSVSSW
jgi:hypothetical protein